MREDIGENCMDIARIEISMIDIGTSGVQNVSRETSKHYIMVYI